MFTSIGINWISMCCWYYFEGVRFFFQGQQFCHFVALFIGQWKTYIVNLFCIEVRRSKGRKYHLSWWWKEDLRYQWRIPIFAQNPKKRPIQCDCQIFSTWSIEFLNISNKCGIINLVHKTMFNISVM